MANRPSNDIQTTEENGQIALRLLCTTDLHGHVLPWDYTAGRRDCRVGLARLAPLIRAHRRRCANTLLFDNGDFLHGNPMADAESVRLAAGGAAPHAVAVAMNALGYDAGTLGNHEFNRGLELLRRVLDQLAHPVTSANLRGLDAFPLAPSGLLLRRRLRDAAGRERLLRIGVLGLAPPQCVEWDRRWLAGRVGARDMVAAARARAGALRQRGADLVVALAHSGLGPEAPAPPCAENAGRALAALPGIDALFLGHSHEVHPAPGEDGLLHGTPVAQAGRFGSHLGVIDLGLARDATGHWRVVHARSRSEAPGPASAQVHREMVAASAWQPHLRMLEQLRRPVGRSRVPIDSHFALVAPDVSLQLLCDAWRRSAIPLLAGRAEAMLPLLTVAAPFRSGGHGGARHFLSLPAGPVTERHLRALQPHPDQLCLSVVDGAALAGWLEQGARLFRRLLPGSRDQALIDPSMPPYGFDVIDGLTWRIDPTRPIGARIDDLRHAGRVVAPDDRFVVAVSSHRLSGTGPLARALRQGQIPVPAQPLRAALRAHLAAGPVAPRPRRSWRFAALPGTAAWFEAPDAARRTVSRVAARGIAPLAPARDGLLRFELRLGPQDAARPIDFAPRLGYGGCAMTRTPRCPAAMTP